MNLPYHWIDCPSWELDFFALPHRIPWPESVDEAISKHEPFEIEHLLAAIELMGPDPGQPWLGFKLAASHFEELTEALEDSEIRKARALLKGIEEAHLGSAFRLFHEAHLARMEGDLDRTVDLYKEAAEKAPGIAEIWNNLATTLSMAKRRDEAVAAFRQALALDSQSRTALEGLAQLRELVKLMRDPNDPKSALYVEIPQFREMASKQIDSMGADPEQLLNYGEELYRAGIVPEVGLSALEKARALRPDDPRALLAVASVYRGLGRAEEAKAAMVHLTELFPDKAEAFYHLAQVCNSAGDTDGERAAIQRVLELDPNVRPALGIWFALKPGEHDPKKEQELIDFAKERASWMAYMLASALCRERGDAARAMRWAQEAVVIAPESEDALLHFATTIGDAKDVSKLANEIKPKVGTGKFSKRLDWNYAHVLRQLGLNTDAINVLRNAASKDAPDDFKASCSTAIEAWSGLLTGSNVPVEVHSSGMLLRDILLSIEDEDGGVILNAGQPLPGQGVFPWRASGSETSVFLQQGQNGSAREPQSLGEFKIRGIQPSEGATIECHLTALPDGALHFRAAQNGKRLQVGWVPPRAKMR